MSNLPLGAELDSRAPWTEKPEHIQAFNFTATLYNEADNEVPIEVSGTVAHNEDVEIKSYNWKGEKSSIIEDQVREAIRDHFYPARIYNQVPLKIY